MRPHLARGRIGVGKHHVAGKSIHHDVDCVPLDGIADAYQHTAQHWVNNDLVGPDIRTNARRPGAEVSAAEGPSNSAKRVLRKEHVQARIEDIEIQGREVIWIEGIHMHVGFRVAAVRVGIQTSRGNRPVDFVR